MSKQTQHYSFNKVVARAVEVRAKYILVVGERSNGKTYGAEMIGLDGLKVGNKQLLNGYIQNGSQFAIVRRWKDDFTGKRGATMFDGVVNNGEIVRMTGGKWDQVYYYSGRWYLAKFDKELNKIVHDETPFAYAFAITSMEHDKSTSYPKIDKIIFDEFLTRGMYLPDEFVQFMNVISTIVRDRNDVTIFMLGNTVNKYCPYFQEMGLTNITKMTPGSIDVYNYGTSDLHVVVEYADTSKRTKKASDVYFAFNNPRLEMITGGAWEIDIHPHLPTKYAPKNVLFQYFIKFGGEILHAEIVNVNDTIFTYIHRKTTPIKDETHDLVYSTEWNEKPNYRRRISRITTKKERIIYSFFVRDKVFYQDNNVGEIVRNYLLWCNAS